ncbi:MAG: CDP-alcohol phosphatidyltransferase family protein [Sphingosinicella sp.]|nr:CDP-alcohol phosphatidyltransferase family protein [Sphingosinicella sp.]
MSKIVPVGQNDTQLWGMSSRERLRRIAVARGLQLREEAPGQDFILVNLGYAFDPSWLSYIAQRPNTVVTYGGVPILAHIGGGARGGVVAAMEKGEAMTAPAGLIVVAQENMDLANNELRKRERPFMDRLTPDTVRSLERASYFGAYKGVTDILTKYLWPEWALVLTRIAARMGVTPNMVTALGALACVAATFLFYEGWYWTGLAVGLAFMVLDTVDGKLARCTITSSWWGNIFDHGIDLIHPPFWWYAWGAGLAAYGRPLDNETFWEVMLVIVGGYGVQRLIEGVFMRMFKMHIHVWRQFDSRFRLITARRNPNMVILFASLIIGRPDVGLIAVAGWTLVSVAVHSVQLIQALRVRSKGGMVRSWLA